MFCLNPLGDEGSMLSQLSLTETPARTVITARFLAGVALGLPISLVGAAVMVFSSPPVSVAGGLTVLFVVLLVVASAGLALGIGAALPRFGRTRLFGSVEAVAPSTTAAIAHGVVALLFALGATNLPGVAVHATAVGPGWSRGLALVAFALVLLGLADGGRRYATLQLDTYGTEDASVGTPLAVYTAVGLAGLSFVIAQAVTVATLTLGVFAHLSDALQLVVLFLTQYAGFALVAVGFLYTTRRGLASLDLSITPRRDAVYAVAGVIGALLVWVGSNAVTSTLGLPAANQSLVESVASDPTRVLVLVVLVVLVNAPVEELLYCNVVQKSLAETVDATTAILLTSALFALVHLPAYFPNPVALAVSLASLFVLSCLWGALYHRTGSLVVAALAHGLYNAVLLGVAYLSVVG